MSQLNYNDCHRRRTTLCWCDLYCHWNMNIIKLQYMYRGAHQGSYRLFQNTGLNINVSIKVLACRTGIIFSRISGRQRQLWSEQGVPDAWWGKNIFFYALCFHTCLVFLAWFGLAFARLKSEKSILCRLPLENKKCRSTLQCPS